MVSVLQNCPSLCRRFKAHSAPGTLNQSAEVNGFKPRERLKSGSLEEGTDAH